MSTYKHKNSRFYSYEFYVQGQKFRGSTGKTSKREAQKFEKQKRYEVIEGMKVPSIAEMTLNQTLGYFWEHFGRHDSDSDTTFGRLERLTDGLGGDLQIADLDDSKLIRYSLMRRATPMSTRGGKLPEPASINREIELLRRALKRVRKPLKFLMPDLEWKEALRPEPEERVVEVKEEEREAIFAAVREDAHALFEHYFLTGVRLSMAITLRWSAIDWEAETVRFIGKGNRETIQPLTPATRVLYQQQMVDNPTDCVFTYVAQRNRVSSKVNGRATIKGQRYPYTLSQVRTLWRRTIERAEKCVPTVKRLRVHDIRHDFATKVYRDTKDPLITQKLLGHRDARSTRRYVHNSTDDIRKALAHHHNTRNGTRIFEVEPPKHLKSKGQD